VGYLPEERGVYKRMRVKNLLGFFAELKGIARREAAPKIEYWLERLDLKDWTNARVQELSKGMQQKIQFIGTMLHDPEVVVLDEPFSGLDPINQQVLREIIVDLKREGRTILFSTHIIDHAERICDHVCIIARGTKVADGPIPAVRREHGGEYIAVRAPEQTEIALGIIKREAAVVSVREQAGELRVTLRDGADPQDLLVRLVDGGIRLDRFERAHASLEQIFLTRVGAVDPAAVAEEVAHV
jgi:ABC-2 type transport system ATP-binding protein